MKLTYRVAAGLAVGALAVLMSACNSTLTLAPAEESARTTEESASGPAAAPTGDASTDRTPAASTSAAPTAAVADPPLPPRPKTTAGPLDAGNLPAATRIGPTFTPHAEPDSAEDGSRSNGAPVRQRDPGEVASSIVPLGCPGSESVAALPVPVNALEETYRTREQRSAVALVLDYGSDAAATALVERLAAMLAYCTRPTPTDPLTTPRLVATVSRPDKRTLFDSRYEVGPGASPSRWDETVVRDGSRVGLAIVERAASAPAGDQRGLASHIRDRIAD
ncbi:hypothetical protein [Actinopolymorpha pittospori]|uniref:PknH-like extracellular domain-containing protein n=1 Tax=Actinopolymorpha pittospori TaxID=648752 RepID=A0A927N600_9ACTN|nr:hypothetical protein [Actinopolymorpha pittospori]MBE1612307.1 hypothetical protein [Actinopolymorpha pittospori]